MAVSAIKIDDFRSDFLKSEFLGPLGVLAGYEALPLWRRVLEPHLEQASAPANAPRR